MNPEEVAATRTATLTLIKRARQENEATTAEVRDYAREWMAKSHAEGDEAMEWAFAVEARRAVHARYAMDQALDRLLARVEGRA